MMKYIVLSFMGQAVGFVTHQAPAVTSTYDTVRWGPLQEFQVNDLVEGQKFFHTGVDGRTFEYEVMFNDLIRGSAEVPDEYVFIARRRVDQ